ncbi:MAG: DUF5060 domain-containing protein [Bacteroidota bacterium]
MYRKVLLFSSWCILTLAVGAQQRAGQWQVVDLPFEANQTVSQPFDEAFGAVIRHEDGDVLRVPGFYNGRKQWVLRFAPEKPGRWSITTYSSLAELAGQERSLLVTPPTKNDEHGPIIIDPKNPKRFAYADGTPYHLMAYELDWLFALDWQNKSGIPRTENIIDYVQSYGFNQVVMNVYAYNAQWGQHEAIQPEHDFREPKTYPFLGTNDNPDYSALNISFFQHLDRVMAHLDEVEMIAHLMIYVWNKKVNWPAPNSKADNLYFDYVVKRYQAFPNLVWDISKEALAYGRDDMGYITERINRLRKLDAHDRLVSVHDYTYCQAYPGKVDFISIQEWKPNLYDGMREVAARHPDQPIFNIEHGGYETTIHEIFGGAYNDPLICLDRNYQCVFAGTYSTHYWQNTSWHEVVHNPKDLPAESQPHLSWFKHLMSLMDAYDYDKLSPYQNAFTPWGLTDPSSSLYLFYMPPGLLRVTGTVHELKDKTVAISWFNPLTGELKAGGEKTFDQGTWLGLAKDPSWSNAVCILEVQ